MIVDQTTTSIYGENSFGRPTEAIGLQEFEQNINLVKLHQDTGLHHLQNEQPFSLSAFALWNTEDCTALVHALIASFSVILVSELGDKTFIITAIMSMQNSRSLVFLGSALALFIMTVLAVGMGVAVTVIPEIYTHYASIVLFLFFGLKMLKEAYDMDGDQDGEDFEAVERSLKQTVKSGDEKCSDSMEQLEKLDSDAKKLADSEKDDENQLGLFQRISRSVQVAPVIIKVFVMIFVAEWGDRSQISTIILAAREDVVGVFVGSFLGHVFCTGLAVVSGRFVADMISVRTMTIIGAIIFLFFAVFELVSN